MKSILVVAIGVAVAAAVLGSMAFQFFAPIDNVPQQMKLEEKCQKIATEGFSIQVKYSEINFECSPIFSISLISSIDKFNIR